MEVKEGVKEEVKEEVKNSCCKLRAKIRCRKKTLFEHFLKISCRKNFTLSKPVWRDYVR